MAHKVLTLLWNLAQSEDVTTDIMDQALAAHIKILDYSCSQVCSQVCKLNYTKMLTEDETVLCICSQISPYVVGAHLFKFSPVYTDAPTHIYLTEK